MVWWERWTDLLLLCTTEPFKHFNGRVGPCCTETNDLGGIKEARGCVTSMDVARRKGGGGGYWRKRQTERKKTRERKKKGRERKKE